MDVSGWTIDQKMRLPDWCFGNRQVIAAYANTPEIATCYWGISEIALPDPVCIWSLGWWLGKAASAYYDFRFGLRDTVPTSIAEMDTAVEILPYLGSPHAGPNTLRVEYIETAVSQIDLKKGMVTGGKKLVVEIKSSVQWVACNVFLVCSELPTDMASWLAHNKV